MVQRRIRHTSSAVGRPAGTGARSHWSSSDTQREEERERERECRQEKRGGTEGGETETEKEQVEDEEQGAAGWGLPPQRLQWKEEREQESSEGDSEKRRWEEKRKCGEDEVFSVSIFLM